MLTTSTSTFSSDATASLNRFVSSAHTGVSSDGTLAMILVRPALSPSETSPRSPF